MLRLETDNAKAVGTFVESVVASGRVWVLDDAGSVAGCLSNDQNADVFPVFSDAAEANRGAACWEGVFPAVEITLETFTETVLPYSIAHGQLMGPNWDANMAGAEIDAAELLAMIREAGG